MTGHTKSYPGIKNSRQYIVVFRVLFLSLVFSGSEFVPVYIGILKVGSGSLFQNHPTIRDDTSDER